LAAGLFLGSALLPMIFFMLFVGTEGMSNRLTTIALHLMVTYGLLRRNGIARLGASFLLALKLVSYFEVLWNLNPEDALPGGLYLLILLFTACLIAFYLINFDRVTVRYIALARTAS